MIRARMLPVMRGCRSDVQPWPKSSAHFLRKIFQTSSAVMICNHTMCLHKPPQVTIHPHPFTAKTILRLRSIAVARSLRRFCHALPTLIKSNIHHFTAKTILRLHSLAIAHSFRRFCHALPTLIKSNIHHFTAKTSDGSTHSLSLIRSALSKSNNPRFLRFMPTSSNPSSPRQRVVYGCTRSWLGLFVLVNLPLWSGDWLSAFCNPVALTALYLVDRVGGLGLLECLRAGLACW